MREPNIGDIRDQLVNIQLSLTRTLAMLTEIQTASGCAEEMEDDPDEGHPLTSNTQTPSVGPVELRRAAELIKGMGFKPKGAKSDERAQTGEVIGYTDRSIWLCPRCVIAITDLEYVHLNLNGCCDECETKLEQYEKVEWRP